MAIHKLYKAIHQLMLLRLNTTETACLKTLILFRPGEYSSSFSVEIAFFLFVERKRRSLFSRGRTHRCVLLSNMENIFSIKIDL